MTYRSSTINISGGSAGSFTSLTVTGLTAGRVVYTGTGGLLSVDDDFQYTSGNLLIGQNTNPSNYKLAVNGNVGVTGTISAAGQVNASAFATTGYLASTYSTKLLLAGESTDNFATFVVTNGAGRTYYMGPGVGDGAVTSFALYDNTSGATRWRSTDTGFDVTGVQTITANSASTALNVVQNGAGYAIFANKVIGIAGSSDVILGLNNTTPSTGRHWLVNSNADGTLSLGVAGVGDYAVLSQSGSLFSANSSSPALTVTQSGAGGGLAFNNALNTQKVRVYGDGSGTNDYGLGMDSTDMVAFVGAAGGFSVKANDYDGTTWARFTSGGLAVTGYIAGAEQTAPSAPGANGYRIFAQDNGAGKTQLMVIFATGAAQQIAIEP